VAALSPEIEKTYQLAQKMRDLKLGDVHLIEAKERGDQGGKLYVSIIICQSRVKGSVSAIRMPQLHLGLQKVAQAADKINATVHLPRIGADLDTTSWYSVEKLIRDSLAKNGIPTYICYFPRRAHKKVPSKQSVHHTTTTTTTTTTSQKNTNLTKSPTTITSRTEDTKEQSKPRQTLPDIFKQVMANLFEVGDSIRELKGNIIAYGGKISPIIDNNSTHVITTLSKPDKLLSISLKNCPSVVVVNKSWISECILQQTLLDSKPYQLL